MTYSEGSTTEYKKPLPRPALPELTKPFWEATKRHELVIQHCNQCDNYFFFPRELCPNCLADRWEWEKVSGKGRLYAFTTVYQPAHPAFNDDAPFVHAMIMLDEGCPIISNVIGVDPDPAKGEVQVNMRLEVTFDDITEEWTLPRFRPAKE